MGTNEIVLELNRLFITDKDKYKEECDYWKARSYKIYRDTKGRHKVIEPSKPQETDINEAFGGIFGEIFSGKSSK